MTNANSKKKVEREARLRWVPIAKMRINELAQRELNQARVDRIVANLDLEQIGTPTVNLRDGHWYVIDGQHRVEALRAYGFGGDQLQCWAYEGLSEDDEAEKFLKLNDTLQVDAMSKFRVGVQAGREVECDIDRIVRSQDLVVSRDKIPGAIRAVGTLRRVYSRSNAATFRRTLAIIRDAYGDAGFEAQVIDGIGHIAGRYNGQLDDTRAIEKLGNAHGGVKGLINKANQVHDKTGKPKGHCVAAAAVDIYNRGAKGDIRLPSWWKDDGS